MPAGFLGPRLRTPRRPPSRWAVIDPTHPLARGLVFYALPGVSLRDYISGLVGTPFGSAGIGSAGPLGPTLHTTTNTGADGMDWGSKPSAFVQTISHAFTIYARFNFAPSGFSNNDLLLSVPWVSGNGTTSPFHSIALFQNGTTGEGALGYTDGSSIHHEVNGLNTSFYSTSDVWASYAGTRSGTAARLYKNGAFVESLTFDADNAISFTAGPAGPVTAFSPNRGAAQWGIKGDGAVFAIWNRALSDLENLIFNQDPFALLVEPMPPTAAWLLGGVVGPTSISVSDSATGSESLSISVTLNPSDSGSGSDSVSLGTITPAVSDSGSGSESESILATLNPTDSASGTDTPSLGTIGASVADSGAGDDSGVALGTISPAPSDSGAGADSESTVVLLSPTDTGSGAEGESVFASVPVTESGSGSEGVGGSMTLAPSDTGSGGDGVAVNKGNNSVLISDSATGNFERIVALPSVLLCGPGLTGSISRERFIITGP